MPEVPKYIAILDATGQTVAYLSPETDGITDCEITEELNGRTEISFRLPLTSEKVSELRPERRIRAGGKEFVILAPASEERIREGRKTWLKITALEAQFVELGKQYPTVANDYEPNPPWGTVSILARDLGRAGFPPGSAGSALYRLLEGAGWTIGTVDTTGSLIEQHDHETERLPLLENIQRVQETWGGYLLWDSIKKTVSLRDEEAWQPGSGVEIRYGKNLKGVERIVDSDLVTRLYPFGRDNLTIAGVNNGQIYIEDHHYTDAVYEGIWQDQNINDPEALLKKAREVLKKLSEPRVSYRVDLADLSVLPEYRHETFALGDIVRIVDPEMGIDVRARVVKRTWNVFQPWKVTVEIGQPTETLAAMIAEGRQSSRFVERVLKPNPGTNNLLKGFIDTFRTRINSANGKLIWSNDALEAIEVDANGNETGRRVRITPGGVGISTDGGQTYTTAITGQGVLANTVVVSDLYALATDDGYTQLRGDGLHVVDPEHHERVHVGRWFLDGLEHYGIRIFSRAGTVMLDDRGLLQTWEVSKRDNVDTGFPLRVRFFLPPEIINIHRIILRFYLDRFRTHSRGAASGGGVTSGPSSISTTASGGGVTSGPSSRETTASGGGVTSGPSSRTTTSSGGGVTSGPSSTSTTASGGGTTSGPSSRTTTASGGGTTNTRIMSTYWEHSYLTGIIRNHIFTAAHDHGITSGKALRAADGSAVYFYSYAGETHAHDMYGHGHYIDLPSHTHDMNHTHSIPDHTHGMAHTHTIPSHTHEMDHTHTIPAHTHDMDHTHDIPPHTHGMDHTHYIPPHTHDLIFGIYEGAKATGITVKVNGLDVTDALGGPFSTDQDMLDISKYVTVGMVNTVELSADGLGLIDASVFIQVLLGV